MSCIIWTCQLTPKKSYCIRIGHRLNNPCYCITTSTYNGIAWYNSCKYLGVYPLVDRQFKCNSDEAIAKYHRTFNGSMGKVGRSALNNNVWLNNQKLLMKAGMPSVWIILIKLLQFVHRNS